MIRGGVTTRRSAEMLRARNDALRDAIWGEPVLANGSELTCADPHTKIVALATRRVAGSRQVQRRVGRRLRIRTYQNFHHGRRKGVSPPIPPSPRMMKRESFSNASDDLSVELSST